MKKVWNWIKSLLTKADILDLLEEGKKLAVPIVESLLKKDLDGDGVIAARTEILQVAEQFGLNHLKRIAVQISDSAEMKRLLAISRTAVAIAISLGVKNVPQYRVLELIVSGAFNVLDPQ